MAASEFYSLINQFPIIMPINSAPFPIRQINHSVKFVDFCGQIFGIAFFRGVGKRWRMGRKLEE